MKSRCQYYHSFVVIDLYGQQEAIYAYVQNWSKSHIFDWLAIYGKIYSFLSYYGWEPYKSESSDLDIFDSQNFYVFIPYTVSHPLYQNGFRFDDDGKLEINDLSRWRGR